MQNGRESSCCIWSVAFCCSDSISIYADCIQSLTIYVKWLLVSSGLSDAQRRSVIVCLNYIWIECLWSCLNKRREKNTNVRRHFGMWWRKSEVIVRRNFYQHVPKMMKNSAKSKDHAHAIDINNCAKMLGERQRVRLRANERNKKKNQSHWIKLGKIIFFPLHCAETNLFFSEESIFNI